ncbi:MAG TPA: IPT/TIG domain-containing protein, partial [Solirubrobacteraceae bacterium]|nr:IPT/TIG domain-containing protein [Solirubrobacteraceae bacterium]
MTGVSPNNGSTTGGTSVTIKGSGFIAGSTVKFAGSSASGVTINSETSITASSPAGTGLVNVTVTNANGTSTSAPADQFAYDPAPSGPWLGLNGNSAGAYLGT